MQKPGPRGECCSPDESLAEGQHQRKDLNGFVLAERRQLDAGGKCCFGMDMLALEERQQKSWGLGEKSHTIFGRCTECLSSNTLSEIELHPFYELKSPIQKHDIKPRNLTLQWLRQSFQQLNTARFSVRCYEIPQIKH